MRASQPFEQRTRDTYAIAAIIDGKLETTTFISVNMTAIGAAEAGYRKLTNKVEESYIVSQSFKEMSVKDGWHNYEVVDLVSGTTEISVRLVSSTRV